MVEDGVVVFEHDAGVARWAGAAAELAVRTLADPALRAAQMRHDDTWFVGVNALANAADGSVADVPLAGPWQPHVGPVPEWHPAQLSVVYPGFPGRDPQETDASFRYRTLRFAAHVDGLLAEGDARRRYLREPHAFILGLPLSDTEQAPLVVWPGSHRVMGDAFRAAIADQDPLQVDLTDAYHAARRRVFDTIAPRRIAARPGQSVLLHRHLLHGVAPWPQGAEGPPEGRMVAYFRPQFGAQDWLSAA